MRNPDTLSADISTKSEDTPQGLGFAVGAYVMWGFLPLYMKAIAHIPAAEIVVHRIIWSVPVGALVLILLGRTATLREAFRSPRTLLMGCVTASLISINWGIYIWAVNSGHALDASLGYYINPLFSILLASVLLGERLSKLQMAAIALAAVAVGILTVDSGKFPWVALSLTLTFGLYALAKKRLPIGPNQGFLLEVLILLIPALIYLGYLSARGQTHFFQGTPYDTWMLFGCGLVTAVPLILYANGAKRLRLSTISILQYIAPTMIFLCAVLVFGEPFGRARMIAFPMIWAALVIYSISLFRQMRHK
ncbi:EamA family transporter RarD [uncultured Sulfitobacter sp.]|uniref:EamA family transporter RarD n=1 Tax=uncultured Sulfitobacter sp. TaxID=191468 RepID=UPI0030D7B207|tara:strand:- start:74051 stop:74971 length:921 start_codon:yes stop_codon:yes gene_type:complete